MTDPKPIGLIPFHRRAEAIHGKLSRSSVLKLVSGVVMGINTC